MCSGDLLQLVKSCICIQGQFYHGLVMLRRSYTEIAGHIKHVDLRSASRGGPVGDVSRQQRECLQTSRTTAVSLGPVLGLVMTGGGVAAGALSASVPTECFL